MKFSFMTFSTPSAGIDELIAIARQYGYDAIEPRLDEGHAHGIEVTLSAAQRATIRTKMAESGVSLCCLATSCCCVETENPDLLFAIRDRIQLAGELGVPAIRVFGGEYPETVTREEAMDRVVATLRTVAPFAEQYQVFVCLETHDAWCDPTHVAEVMERVNHPWIAVNWDVMHPVRTRLATVEESFALLRPWIRHLHVHDGIELNFVPMGDGEIDHRRAVELLVQNGYQGALSGEWIEWEPYEIHLPRELQTLRSYM